MVCVCVSKGLISIAYIWLRTLQDSGNKLVFIVAKHCFSQKGSFAGLCGIISGHYLKSE